jgi:hypothetical protein
MCGIHTSSDHCQTMNRCGCCSYTCRTLPPRFDPASPIAAHDGGGWGHDGRGNDCDRGGIICNVGIALQDVSFCVKILQKLNISQSGPSTTAVCSRHMGRAMCGS